MLPCFHHKKRKKTPSPRSLTPESTSLLTYISFRIIWLLFLCSAQKKWSARVAMMARSVLVCEGDILTNDCLLKALIRNKNVMRTIWGTEKKNKKGSWSTLNILTAISKHNISDAAGCLYCSGPFRNSRDSALTNSWSVWLLRSFLQDSFHSFGLLLQFPLFMLAFIFHFFLACSQSLDGPLLFLSWSF